MLLSVFPKSMCEWEWRCQVSVGVLTETSMGVTVLINVRAATRLGVKRTRKAEQGNGEGERHSMTINICHHQNLVSLTLQPPPWRRWWKGSAAIREGAASVPALETWSWNTASLSGAKSMEGHHRVTLTSRAQRSNVSHLSWPWVQVF